MGTSGMQHVNVTSTSRLLSGLDIFTNYTIFVEAVTVAIGDRSEEVTVRTDEDGKGSEYSAMASLWR